MSELRVLSANDLRQVVTMSDAVGLMRSAFAELSSGDAIVPQRIVMEMLSEKSRAIVMPAYSPNRKRYSTKIVTLSGNNAAREIPFIHGVLLLFDSDSGIPLALMDAQYVTALRTGAASGLATNLLARTDSHTCMIFGAGTQARTQLEGIAAVRKLDRVLVFSPVKTEMDRFCKQMGPALGLEVVATDSPKRVSDADVICTATSSEVPVFDHANLKPGVHINGIGSYKPTMRELPSQTIKEAKLVVDSRVAAMSEAGDIVIPISEGMLNADHIHAELGEIVLGNKSARTSDNEITVFKSVGNAVQDLVVAAFAFEKSVRLNLGSLCDL